MFKIDIDELKSYLNNSKSVNDIDYKVFGTSIEQEIGNFFKDKKYSLLVAKDKNEFPDFRYKYDTAIEIKSSIYGENPANDMGTLNSWKDKMNKFDNIFVIFIFYEKEKKNNRIAEIFYDKVWNFIGINRDGFLSYREKDGNLRPKKFSDMKDNVCYVEDKNDFIKKIDETIVYRSKRIINKHLKLIERIEKEGEEDYISE